MTKEQMKKLKLCNEAAQALQRVFANSWHNYAAQLFTQSKIEEQEHRRGSPAFGTFAETHTPDSIGVMQAAKLCAVGWVAKYMLGKIKLPTVAEYFHTKRSCFMSAAIVAEFKEQIETKWQQVATDNRMSLPDLVEALAALDYCEFVKIKPDEVAA